VAHDLDDLLDRTETLENRLVGRLVANTIDERLDDLEVDVGLEQRETDLAQRRLDMLRGQPDLAAEAFECALNPVADRLEHGWTGGPLTLDGRVSLDARKPL